MLLQQLRQQGHIWQFKQAAVPTAIQQPVYSTGFTVLDQAIGGWPVQQVIELQCRPGCGELRLLLPYLKQQLSEQQRWLVFLNSPARLNAAFLLQNGIALERVIEINASGKEALWAAEQCLKSGSCQTVLFWQNHLQIAQLKRLQLAAVQGQAELFLYRPLNAEQQLPVSLSLSLQGSSSGLQIRVQKRRGGWAGQQLQLHWANEWPQLCLPESVLPLSAQAG
jgi:cell division inhibitor SulA